MAGNSNKNGDKTKRLPNGSANDMGGKQKQIAINVSYQLPKELGELKKEQSFYNWWMIVYSVAFLALLIVLLYICCLSPKEDRCSIAWCAVMWLLIMVLTLYICKCWTSVMEKRESNAWRLYEQYCKLTHSICSELIRQVKESESGSSAQETTTADDFSVTVSIMKK